MKILVTGATGFIGGAFVRLARRRGHTVAALTRAETASRQGWRDGDGLLWLGGSLAEPPWAAIARFAPDHCLHTDYLRWSIAFFQLLKASGIGHAMALGTCIEYRIDGRPAKENVTPLEPLSPYARAKDALRRTVEAEIASPDFAFCWGRVFYPYGPGEHPSRLCSALARKLRAGESLLLKTPGSTKDYIYIDDLAAAILATMERGLTGAVNLGTGQGVTVRDIARNLARLLNREHLVGESSQPEPDPFHYVVADPTRLVSEAAWQPQCSLEAGLRAIAGKL